MENQSIISEYWHFLKVYKKYWLLPMLMMMALFVALVVATGNTVVAPFVYSLF